MGVCYQLIMEDEWDWGYREKSKDLVLKEFESKFGRYIQRIAEWDCVVVYDIDKASPFNEERQGLIREYADRAYYRDDMGVGIREIELPRVRPSEQAYLDDIENRRTDEEKKAAEAMVRKKLKVME